MSLLEAPCAKTSWRALLFRAILGITGALIVCFDIWWFKQVNNSETGFSGHHCDFEQHVPCLAVHVCMNSVKFVLKAPGASILWGRYYSVIMCRLIWGALLLGGALLIGTLRYFDFSNCRAANRYGISVFCYGSGLRITEGAVFVTEIQIKWWFNIHVFLVLHRMAKRA